MQPKIMGKRKGLVMVCSLFSIEPNITDMLKLGGTGLKGKGNVPVPSMAKTDFDKILDRIFA